MADMPRLTLVKRFTYRGAPEEWSNTYHFAGAPQPSTDAGWETLARAVWAAERTVLRSSSQLVRAYGYAPGAQLSSAQIDFTIESDFATLVGGNGDSGAQPAGDQAVWIRAKIGTSSKGKNVYVRKYYHDVPSGSGGGDAIHPLTKDKLTALGVKLLDGTIAGGFVWRGPDGETPIQPARSEFMTTRTLKRRGKRPTTP